MTSCLTSRSIASMRSVSKRALRPLSQMVFAALLGTPDSCRDLTERLEAIGVDEVACLVDFGVDTVRILASLPQAVGLDLQIRKLRWMRAPGRQLVAASLSELPFGDGSFDAVICSEVIEHIPHDEIVLSDMVRVLQPGGTLVLGTPDYGRWIWRTLEGMYKKVFPQGYATEHINPYTRRSLRQEIESMGLVVLDVQYVGASEMIFKAVKPADASSRGGAARLR